MKILLFGKDGQVGWELQRSLSVLGEVVALDFDSTEHCGDFSNLAGLADTIRTIQPQVIVNAAAHTAVDKAESEPDLAHTLNALAPQILAQEAQKIGAWLVHYSTDYVFDGSGNTPWKETNTPAPLSIYGKTKLAGEQLIKDSGCQYLIFRTSWVYATRGKNFAKTILRLAGERDRLTIIDDQIGAPTGADLLADVTAHAISHIMQPLQRHSFALSGIYHVAAGGHVSWHGYARFVLESALKMGVILKTTPDNVDPISTSAYPTPAKRPHNSRLDKSLLQKTFSLNLPSWQIGVSRMVHEIIEKQS